MALRGFQVHQAGERMAAKQNSDAAANAATTVNASPSDVCSAIEATSTGASDCTTRNEPPIRPTSRP